VPGVFPGGKGSQCIRLTTFPPSCATVMKSGNLNFLEPSGPLQACNGTVLEIYLAMATPKENTLIKIQWYHKTLTESTSDMENGGVTKIENSKDQ